LVTLSHLLFADRTGSDVIFAIIMVSAT